MELEVSELSDTEPDKVAVLLEAALPEFASAGLDGARVDAIARAAGMNKRLLYHYVGDKAALFAAALDLAYDRILSAPRDLNSREWRLVCHGAACGRTGRLGELAAESSAENARALGLRLLAALLPELADGLLGNAEGDDAGRLQAVQKALSTPANSAPKPRLKLRPELRKGSAPAS